MFAPLQQSLSGLVAGNEWTVYCTEHAQRSKVTQDFYLLRGCDIYILYVEDMTH